MVQVPVSTRNSVQVQPLDTKPLRYAESRNYMGPALEQAGQALGRAADDIDEIEATYDQADVLNIDNTMAAEASAAANEFGNLRGDQPGRELQDRLKSLETRAEELVGGARSERAANIARRTLSTRLANTRAKLTQHADDEMFKFREGALIAGRDQAVNDAIGSIGTPQFEIAIGTGLTRVQERASLVGASDEVAQLARSEFLDDVHGGVIDTLFAVPDPDVDSITGYLDKYGRDMTAKLRNKVLERLQGPLQVRAARSDADLVLGFVKPTAGDAPVLTPASAAKPMALDMLREFEGFRGATYWDVNHHRVGYGSDTITTATGQVRTVREGDKVSREDAERDLARRTDKLEQTAASRSGAGWNALPAGARAAVVSVAYNYGEAHDRLKPLWAAAASGDANAVANVIAGFAGDNGGVNRERRLQEAEAARGGGTYANAPRKWDRAQVYANLDDVAKREGWNPERTERVRGELDKRISRDEGLLNDQYREANDEAVRIMAERGDAFTSTSQLPQAVRDKMNPTDLAQLDRSLKDRAEAAAEKARKEQEGAQRTAAWSTLLIMKRFEPEKFKQEDLSKYAGVLTPSQFTAAWSDQQTLLRTAPSKFQPQGAISEAITRGNKFHGADIDKDDLPGVYDFMEDYLRTAFEKNGKIGPNDADEAFKAATSAGVVRTSSFLGFQTGRSAVPAYKVTYDDVPAEFRNGFVRNWRGQGKPSKQDVLDAWQRSRAR